jgi:hypothetical protein
VLERGRYLEVSKTGSGMPGLLGAVALGSAVTAIGLSLALPPVASLAKMRVHCSSARYLLGLYNYSFSYT